MRLRSVLVLLLFSFFFLSCNSLEQNPLATNDFNDNLGKSSKSDISLSDNMQVAPFKIILNSRGTDYVIRTIFSGSLPNGYRIDSYDLSLYFNDVKVVDATSFRYCYTDYNYLTEFPRSIIINNSYVRSLAGNTVPVYMKGTYVLKNSNNDIIERSVDRTGNVEVVQP